MSSATSARWLRASPVRTRRRSLVSRPELVAGQGEHARVELEHQAVRTRSRRFEVAGHGEPAAAQVHGVERSAVGGHGVDHVAEQLGVLELQVGRVLEVHVGVAQVVEDELAGRRAIRIGADVGAEVGRLDVARVAGQRRRAARDHEHGDAGADRRPAGEAAPCPPQRRPAGHQQRAEHDHHRRGGELGDEDEPGAEHPEQRPGGAEGRQLADDLAGLGHRVQLQLDDHRCHGAEQERRHEERGARRGTGSSARWRRRRPARRCG